MILVVHEDWAPDGAGNGLGTLYAYSKARIKAATQGVDIDAKLNSGQSPKVMFQPANRSLSSLGRVPFSPAAELSTVPVPHQAHMFFLILLLY